MSIGPRELKKTASILKTIDFKEAPAEKLNEDFKTVRASRARILKALNRRAREGNLGFDKELGIDLNDYVAIEEVIQIIPFCSSIHLCPPLIRSTLRWTKKGKSYVRKNIC
jgi:hypothetical protein